jgi:hypothetical protein
LLGPAGRDRDIALALIIARVCRPGSKLATTRWWTDTTLADDLGVADATTDEVYAGMDWLAARQDGIETKLVRTHLAGAANPDRLALFDLSSSWVTGKCCPLAARGYSRDGKKGLPQIEYGLLTDPAGRPVAVRVFPGNTADPTAFSAIVQAVKNTFKLTDMVMVGDRGMITSARVQELRELGGFGWVTALRAPAIAGARSAVTQPNPPSSRSSCTRALVIIPRSPTITMSVSLNVFLTAWTMALNAVGSAVLPGNTRTATGRPAGSVSSPYSICGSPFLPSRE